MTNAASSFTSCVATSRISTTTTWLTPKGTFFSRNNFSTRAGSLAMIRAMAESVDSDTLSATTWVFCVFSNFTTSNIAPTLFGRNTENCFTSGPSIVEVISGRFEVIWIAALHGNFHTHHTNYLILSVSLAKPMLSDERRRTHQD